MLAVVNNTALMTVNLRLEANVAKTAYFFPELVTPTWANGLFIAQITMPDTRKILFRYLNGYSSVGSSQRRRKKDSKCSTHR